MSTRPRTPGHGAPAPGKLPITDLLGMKESRSPIAMITAYDAPSGRLADAAGADVILVGDSAAMTVLGHDSTVPATMEEMLVLTRAVTRGARRPLIVADMPFGSFQVSDELAVTNAIRFVKDAGADAVKLEGRRHDALPRARDRRCRRARDGAHRPDAAVGDRARRLQGAGPDSGEGGAARTRRARARGGRLLLARARGRSLPVAARITELLAIPTIGIGAGAVVDGQVLVWHDLLGLYDGQAPRFVKQYAQLATEIQRAVEAYVGDVRERRFPEEVHTYGMPAEELAAFEAELGSAPGRVPRSGTAEPRRGQSADGSDGERRHDHGCERQRSHNAAPRQLERRPQADGQQRERPQPRTPTPTATTTSPARAVVGASGPEPVAAEREARSPAT